VDKYIFVYLYQQRETIMVYPINKETLEGLKRSRLTSLTIRFRQELITNTPTTRDMDKFKLMVSMIDVINKKMK
jgi:hypothetical protein